MSGTPHDNSATCQQLMTTRQDINEISAPTLTRISGGEGGALWQEGSVGGVWESVMHSSRALQKESHVAESRQLASSSSWGRERAISGGVRVVGDSG